MFRPVDFELFGVDAVCEGPVRPAGPLVKRSHELTTQFGGDKDNANYGLMQECIAEYLARGEPLSALRLSQNFALMMLVRETVSFRERHGFDGSAWQKEFSSLCLRFLGDPRNAVE